MIGSRTAKVEEFWRNVSAEMGLQAGEFHVSTFADPRLSPNVDMITSLAVHGNKRATAHMELDFQRNGVERRKPGDFWVVLDAALDPVCLVRVTDVKVLPFDQVGEDMAVAEAEGDLSLEHWRTVHRRYFLKQCAAWGIEWKDDIPVVCEYFDMIGPRPK